MLLKKKRNLKKIVVEQLWYSKRYFTVYRSTHINETYTAETPRASWVDRYMINKSPLSMQVSRCVHSTQDFKRMVKQQKIKTVFNRV